MRYELRLTAFDMLDQVHVVLTLVDSGSDYPVTYTTVLSRATTVRGEGESDPSRWARDALIAALETL